jgi:L-aspartate oxidase
MLDATRLGPAGRTAEFLRERFPTIDKACRERGLDWSVQPIPVTPAAHYWMGGVQTDVWGRTSVPGLFAVGEVACTGVHGANRLASNSLLESLVFAWRCAELLLQQGGQAGAWPMLDAGQSQGSWTASSEPLLGSATVERGALQRLMWSAAGIERGGAGLSAAAEQLRSWRGVSAAESVDVAALETANLLELARVVVGSAVRRQESRGAHFREDFPATDAAQALSIVVQQPVEVPC